MRITINGQEDDVPPQVTVQEILETLSVRTRGIAVERNLEIVPQADYARCTLSEGDRLEIVTLVGGG